MAGIFLKKAQASSMVRLRTSEMSLPLYLTSRASLL